MGKIKQVIMGDIEAEEKARRKGETKRAQKKLAKEEKIEEVVQEVKDEPKEARKKPKKTEGKYHFEAGKKYLAAKKQIEKSSYPIAEAIKLVQKTSYSKFDGSVEVHLNVSEKNLRGSVTLPYGNGKTLRIKIADEALIANSVIDFDVLVATPDMMPKLAKIAKILGPKGLMPNPKTNTISENPAELVKILSSSVQWKTQPDFSIIHAVIGKVSFEPKKLEENFAALTKSIGKDKTTSIFIKATMGPSIRVQI